MKKDSGWFLCVFFTIITENAKYANDISSETDLFSDVQIYIKDSVWSEERVLLQFLEIFGMNFWWRFADK